MYFPEEILVNCDLAKTQCDHTHPSFYCFVFENIFVLCIFVFHSLLVKMCFRCTNNADAVLALGQDFSYGFKIWLCFIVNFSQTLVKSNESEGYTAQYCLSQWLNSKIITLSHNAGEACFQANSFILIQLKCLFVDVCFIIQALLELIYW